MDCQSGVVISSLKSRPKFCLLVGYCGNHLESLVVRKWMDVVLIQASNIPALEAVITPRLRVNLRGQQAL
uniref:Uncharacterized protein n=1 Tax=Rhizophora mucronata TaxID=61149 RepID=A0A2P2MZ07_RHIMU